MISRSALPKGGGHESVFPAVPIFSRSEAKTLTKAADEILHVRVSTKVGHIRHVVTEIAQEVQAAFEPDLVQIDAEVLFRMRVKKAREMIRVAVEKSRGFLAAQLRIGPML